MNKHQSVTLEIIIAAIIIATILSLSVFTIKAQLQQQHLALGQPSKISAIGQQTFRSAFDTFISSYMDEMKTT